MPMKWRDGSEGRRALSRRMAREHKIPAHVIKTGAGCTTVSRPAKCLQH